MTDEGRGRNTMRSCQGRLLLTLLISAVLVAPCLWQPRIQAGDFSSHLYNAWLAQQIEKGQIKGLAVVWQWTNVLFDVGLSALLKTVGFDGAQRIALSLLVLNFFWAAFTLVRVVTGRQPWFLMPCLGILAYGWVFHMGFCNFYLALGLSLWALALLWRNTSVRRVAALPLLLLATLAHALPVAWTVGSVGYVYVARKTRGPQRILLLAGALAVLVVVRMFLTAQFETYWVPGQAIGILGADQAWVFGVKYCFIAVGLLFLWSTLFLRSSEGNISSVAFQLYILTAATVLLIPTRVSIPGFQHALVYISDRMSLPVAVAACLVVGAAKPWWFEKIGLVLLWVLFFSFLYVDGRALNRIEDKMEVTVGQLPPGSRVVSALCDPTSRLDPLTHMVDRVCVRRCFSYANYEPSTTQFRVRATAGNGVVAEKYGDSYALQTGTYVVKEADSPLYQVYLCDEKNLALCTRLLRPGQVAWRTCFQATPSLSSH